MNNEILNNELYLNDNNNASIYDEMELRAEMEINQDDNDDEMVIKLFCMNTNGLNKNRMYINSLLFKYDIIILVETWIIDGNVIDELLCTTTHKIYYHNAIKAYEHRSW